MTKLITKSIVCFVISISAIEEVAAQSNTDTTLTATALKNVTISAKKPLVVHRPDKTIINVAGSILATGNTALEILSKAPGISIDNEGNISLKGKRGVTVMMDGKPSYLSTAQVANLLRATNGNTIASIELISNPSAKYEAAGSGGIINIKLKKNSNYGTNGTIDAGLGYGNYYKTNSGLLINNRTGKINIYGNINYDHLKEFENLDVQRSSSSGTALTYFDVMGNDVSRHSNSSYKAGLDYSVSSGTTIGFLTSGYINDSRTAATSNTLLGKSIEAGDTTIRSDNPQQSRFNNQNYNLNLKSRLDTAGQELSTDLDYSHFNSRNDAHNYNYFFLQGGSRAKDAVIFRSASPANIQIWSGKADYTLPLNPKIKLETGLKSSYVKTDNDYQFENLESDGWQNDLSRSNRFVYQEYINAGYINYHQEFKSISLQLGLRAEQTRSEGNSLTTQNLVKRAYLDFFPNITVRQKIDTAHELGLSFNRRIDRPDYQSLNPFVYFADIYTLAQGNPLLNPQYTNAYTLSYTYKQQLNVSLAYSRTTDVITSTIVTDTLKKTLTLSEQNLALQTLYDLNVSLPIPITKWWESSNDLNVFYRSFSTPNLMGIPFESKKLSYSFNTIHTFSISAALKAELSFNYQSPQVYGTYVAKPLYSTNLGISKSFAENRASIKLGVNDIFNTQQIRIKSTIQNEDYRLSQKAESRVFRLSFSYNFGSRTVKAVRDHTNGATGEQQRVKQGN